MLGQPKEVNFSFGRLNIVFSYFQSQHDELEAKFMEERAALEAKYQKLYQPLYTKVCYAYFVCTL